jgi:hypothetical protein
MVLQKNTSKVVQQNTWAQQAVPLREENEKGGFRTRPYRKYKDSCISFASNSWSQEWQARSRITTILVCFLWIIYPYSIDVIFCNYFRSGFIIFHVIFP